MDDKRLNIVFFGSGAFGLPTLRALNEHHNLLCVVSQPDRPAGRGKTLTPTPISAWAQEHLRPTQLVRPDNVNAPKVVDELQRLPVGPDAMRKGAFVVIAFGQKMGPELLEHRFAINLHASLLPRWRGAAPINHAILAGDIETGNSVITLAQRMDAGLILGQSKRAIDRADWPDTAATLHDELANDGPALILHVLDQYAMDDLRPHRQDEALVTRASKLHRALAQLDLALPAARIANTINGLSPWPGVSARLGPHTLRLLRVAVDAPAAAPHGLLDNRAAGTILDHASGTIRCGGGSSIRLLEVQPTGKKVMTWRDFANGFTPRTPEDARLKPMDALGT
ncbi:MAG: methionyl-tRNA formyltransferase [Phycisphaerales bacterium]|nr:methionyl-tRNA formyltransferase [Phycisphaerales bacterium]